jgi:hypothetical protein
MRNFFAQKMPEWNPALQNTGTTPSLPCGKIWMGKFKQPLSLHISSIKTTSAHLRKLGNQTKAGEISKLPF